MTNCVHTDGRSRTGRSSPDGARLRRGAGRAFRDAAAASRSVAPPAKAEGRAAPAKAEGRAAPAKAGGNVDRAVEGEKPLGSRAPAFVRRSRPLHLGWRAGVFAIGLAVVAGGVVLLPLPGPGWLVIFAGMALWATEFTWAQRVLRWTKRKVAEAARRALEPRVRRRNIALTSVAAAIGIALLSGYVWQYGLVMPWSVSS